MGRIARVVIPGMPHHVTSHGNGCADVFRSPADYKAYLELLASRARHHELSIWSFCLMSDHVHLVVVPQRSSSLAGTLRDVNAAYSHWAGRQYGYNGRLWSGRFSSCVLDQQHLWTAVKFVEQNPVRAGLAARAEEYPWSSAATQCHRETPCMSFLSLPESLKTTIPSWSEWLSERLPDAEAETLRGRTRTGRPCGSDWFVKRIEESLKRQLAPRVGGWKKGRPRLQRQDCLPATARMEEKGEKKTQDHVPGYPCRST